MLNRYWLLAVWSCPLAAVAETGKPVLQPTSALSTENTIQMLGGLVLVLIIIQAMKTGPYMSEPPKGAGAGHTGMYNEHMKSK